MFFRKNKTESKVIKTARQEPTAVDFGKLPKPSGDLLFSVDECDLRLDEPLSENDNAWLVVYNRSGGTYCISEGVHVSGFHIRMEDLIALGHLLSSEDDLSRIRICLYRAMNDHCYYLKHKSYTDKGYLGDEQFVLPLRDKSAAVNYTLSTYLSESGLLSLTSAVRLFVPTRTVYLVPDDLGTPDHINLKAFDNSPDRAPTFWGLYSYAQKNMIVFASEDGLINLAGICDMIDMESLDTESRYYPCLIQGFTQLMCSNLNICMSNDPDSSMGIRPMPLEHKYDSLIAAPVSLTNGKSAVFRRLNNGRIYMDFLPTEDIYKYHNVLTDGKLPENIDHDVFAPFDPDLTEVTGECFFAFVHEGIDALGRSYDSSADTLKVKKRILYNITKMLAAAVNTRGKYESAFISLDDKWPELARLLNEIEDDLIMNTETTRYMKLFLMHEKYGCMYDLEEHVSNMLLKYGDTTLFSVGSMLLRFDIIEIENGKLTVEGCLKLPELTADADLKLVCYMNDVIYDYIPVDRHSDEYVFGKMFQQTRGFKIRIPLTEDRYKLTFGVRGYGIVSLCNNIQFSQIAPLSKTLFNAYYYKDQYVVKTAKSSLLCLACSDEKRAFYEDLLSQEIERRCGEKAGDILSLRKYYWNSQRKDEDDIWIMIDRADRADDNAEVLFRYVVKQNYNHVKPIFVLSQSSSQFAELSEVGTVLGFRTEEHLKAFLTSKYIFSSQFSPSTMNPFNEDFDYFRDIVRQKKFVFLQHGVTKDDNGMGFSRYSRNFYGIVVSGNEEYDYMRSPELSNPPETIWLTGMPRFDRVYNNDQRIITIMPTWRKYLTVRVFDEEQQTNIWKVKDTYKQSEYYNFYNSLINDVDLINAARRKGYRIQLMPHVQFLKQAEDFEIRFPDVVSLCNYDTRYCDVFSESSLILTDFSSVGFDFGYLYKPVLYCQFDKEAFYKNHTMKPGYFDYEPNGFGEVLYDLPDTIDTLISYIENDCRMKEEYRKRVEAFFKYTDHACCERICKRVFELENKD